MSPVSHLRDVFGFDAFRPGQEEIVAAVAAGVAPVVSSGRAKARRTGGVPGVKK